jgi:hypothetical protein
MNKKHMAQTFSVINLKIKHHLIYVLHEGLKQNCQHLIKGIDSYAFVNNKDEKHTDFSLV